jgi:collagen type III alpha
LGKVFWGDGGGGRFGVPEDVDDPVAVAVLEELEAVDASGEGGGVGWGVAGFVGAPDLDDVAELLGDVVGGFFVEAHGGHAGGGAGDVAVDGEGEGVGVGAGGEGGDEAGVGEEEGAHAVPVAGLALGAGDDGVDGVEEGVRCGYVGGLGGGPGGVGGDGAG